MGMSGVIYALFGYVWMKGMYQPEQRMGVHPNTVNLMLIWLVVCMTGVIGPIGNAAALRRAGRGSRRRADGVLAADGCLSARAEWV